MLPPLGGACGEDQLCPEAARGEASSASGRRLFLQPGRKRSVFLCGHPAVQAVQNLGALHGQERRHIQPESREGAAAEHSVGFRRRTQDQSSTRLRVTDRKFITARLGLVFGFTAKV